MSILVDPPETILEDPPESIVRDPPKVLPFKLVWVDADAGPYDADATVYTLVKTYTLKVDEGKVTIYVTYTLCRHSIGTSISDVYTHYSRVDVNDVSKHTGSKKSTTYGATSPCTEHASITFTDVAVGEVEAGTHTIKFYAKHDNPYSGEQAARVKDITIKLGSG